MCKWRHKSVISVVTKRTGSYRPEERRHLFLGLVTEGFFKKAEAFGAESCMIQRAPRVIGRIRQARRRKWWEGKKAVSVFTQAPELICLRFSRWFYNWDQDGLQGCLTRGNLESTWMEEWKQRSLQDHIECHRWVQRQNALSGFCFRNIILEISWQVEWSGKKLKIKEHKTSLQKTWWEVIALIFWLPTSDSLRSPWEKGDFFTWKLDVEIVKIG